MQVEVKVYYNMNYMTWQFLTKIFQEPSIDINCFDYSSIKPVSQYDAGYMLMYKFEVHDGLDKDELVHRYMLNLEEQLSKNTGLDKAQRVEVIQRADKALAQLTSYHAYQSNATHFQKFSKHNPDFEDFWKQYIHTYSKPAPMAYDNDSAFSVLSNELPGMSAVVEYPCAGEECMRVPTSLRTVIIHLNDIHKWTRENIADWLDELHDSGKINIEFEVDVDSEGGES